jgi:DNA-directed RNA polymerase specialized sigma24 family protein
VRRYVWPRCTDQKGRPPDARDLALAQLTPRERQLIAILTADPPAPYAEISARLGIPVGSIGPSRGRCLDKLRRHPAIAALISAEAA